MTCIVPDWDGPGTGFTVLDAVAYVDTVHVLLKLPLPSGLMKKLRESAKSRVQFRPAMRPDAANPAVLHCYGTIVSVAQPTEHELRLFVECGKAYVVCRADVACDFHCKNMQEAKNAGTYLRRHTLQKWRGGRRVNDTENVQYFSSTPKTTRNIAIYHDKPSRKDGSPCAHWEMRFITADACRRAGLEDLARLITGIDVHELMTRQTKIAALDDRRFHRVTEKAARKLKLRYWRGLTSVSVGKAMRRVQGLIFAALQTAHSTPNEQTIKTVMVQEIFDRTPPLRSALVEPGKWGELLPRPRWLS